MDDLKTKILISLFVAMGFVSCIGDTDLTGFIRSTDRIEDRYKISMEYNSVNQFRKIWYLPWNPKKESKTLGW